MKHEVTNGECIYCKQDVDFPHVDNECKARDEINYTLEWLNGRMSVQEVYDAGFRAGRAK